MRRTISRPAAVALATLLGGCMVGPNYKPAAPPPAATGAFVERAGDASALPPTWWRLYRDPTLDALVAEALAHNTDVRVAAANLRRARYVLSEARGQLLPTTSPSAQYTRTRQGSGALGATAGLLGSTATGTTATGGTTTGGTTTGGATAGGANTGANTVAATIPDSFTYDLFSLGLDVSYELDLFGGLRRGVQAARGDYQASAAALDAARVAVAADTARAYGEACGYAEQARAARETLDYQQSTFRLTERLNTGGRGTQRDVDQVRTIQEQSQASVYTFEAEHRAALDALAVLTGRAPAALDPAIARCATPPKLTQPIPSGDGAALLARRPDVRQAERKLAADTARIGVAVADLYPKITLLGSVSLGATRLGDVGTPKSLSYSLGPLISWNFPVQSIARARVHEAEATADASLASFDGAVLVALRETEQALARLDGEMRRNASLARAYAAAANAAKLSRYRFDYGADNFLQLLDAERTRASASAQLAQSNTALLDAQIDLFRALGGGWEQAPAVSETSARALMRGRDGTGASPPPPPAPAPAG